VLSEEGRAYPAPVMGLLVELHEVFAGLFARPRLGFRDRELHKVDGHELFGRTGRGGRELRVGATLRNRNEFGEERKEAQREESEARDREGREEKNRD
jgi:hypothetical protein